jgi:mono/diheme cytochrome c family protein
LKKAIVIAVLFVPIMLGLMSMKQVSLQSDHQTIEVHQKSLESGEKVYKKLCLTCHQADGSGVPNMTPPLTQTTFVLGDKEKLIGIVLNGLKNVDIGDETYNNPMPALGSVLKDQEIADVLTYVRNSFGNKASAVTVEEVKAVRSKNK